MKPVLQLALAGALTLAAAGALAHDYTVGAITIDHPVAKITIPGRPAAAFMTLHNTGAAPDRLVAATSPLAERVELHTHIHDGNVMKMRPVEAIEVPAGGATELAPGGLHLMLFGLKEAVAEGGHIPVTLTFETAGSIAVEALVGPPGDLPAEHDGAAAPADHSGHGAPAAAD